jgi:LysM repeat protein
MKILKFSGIVVGIHLLALVLIFANPGCSSSTKTAPSAGDTVTTVEPAPMITVPGANSSSGGESGASSPSPIAFNSDTSAINAGVRYSPTRPGPAASALQAEPLNVTPATPYTVVSGDSLWSIAKKNHLSIAELAAANNLNPKSAKLQPGQKLIIPGKNVSEAKAQDPAMAAINQPGVKSTTSATAARMSSDAGASTKEGIPHTVRSGETLSTIARRYGVKQGEIAVANNISDPQKIQAGMVLIIPGGWQTPGGKAAKTDSAAAPMDSPAPAEYPVTTAKPAPEVPVIQVEEVPATSKQP